MSVSAVDPLSHPGPWTEEDFLNLPANDRVELLDGSLLVSPAGTNLHQWLSFQLCTALNAAAPRGTRALEAVNVRVAPSRILIPDIAVIDGPDMQAAVTPAAAVRLVVEIGSPSTAYVDRGLKPPLYAAAGIPHYLRVELTRAGPVALLFDLDGERYLQRAQVEPGQVTELANPFVVRLDLAALVSEDA